MTDAKEQNVSRLLQQGLAHQQRGRLGGVGQNNRLLLPRRPVQRAQGGQAEHHAVLLHQVEKVQTA